MPNRRDFLLLRARTTELDCEPLYMRYLDSLDEQTSDDLRASIVADLKSVTTLRLKRTEWLTREDFSEWLKPVVEELKARGVKVQT